MDADRSSGGRVVVLGGLLAALVAYVLVAPFKCTDEGTCDGLVAFHYHPDSAGHWQATAAAALVGGVVALLLWLVLGSEGPRHTVAKVIATPLLLTGMGISVFSQSVLFVLGPLVGGLVLWLMWSPRNRRVDNSTLRL